MESSAFYQLAEALFSALEDALEEADAQGLVAVERTSDNMTIELGDKSFVISRHAPSLQLWLASPLSGGFYFTYDAGCGQWRTASGQEIRHVLKTELGKAAGALPAGLAAL